MANDMYDEAIAVDDDDEDEVSTPSSSGSSGSRKRAGAQRPAGPGAGDHGAPSGRQGALGGDGSDSGDESSTSDESGSDRSSSAGGNAKGTSGPAGAYNPDDFKGLKVSADVEELFQYIGRYKPHTIELDTPLKPFIPELVPSIGEVDAFLKMPRPDGRPDQLGLTRLDEPTLNPTDPSILDIQLRSLSKQHDLQPMEVRSIENVEKNPKEIENWVRRIDELNRTKPAPIVQYSRKMPDIEQLMQVWPAEFEEYLAANPLPCLTDLDIDLAQYTRIIAALLDVPVHGQITESLHVIFTLYSEFKLNQHFSKTAEGTGVLGNGAEQYCFPQAATLGQSQQANVFGGPSTESMAPSRAPSPAGRR
eukprot:gnl/TRDRNA2_/TRDRNA2_193131_c0_seq1.p1 gnl/TRDRNA2_/TRDRNA2_193131_c0~~gnl/TRDRNA2_/TRDRNA2_193131_c0_seq1.p1  ORF type:complete len:406 (-),score=93.06 gnl/TRDRNA2_/TRDRNA2_193131_c0_seq1:148-1236(-)